MRTRITVLASSILVAGCAADTAAYEPVQTFRMSDPDLTCDELRTEITTIEASIADMNNQIKGSKSRASMFSALGMMGATYGGAAAGMEASGAADIYSVKQSYENRHNVLIQQYFAKKC